MVRSSAVDILDKVYETVFSVFKVKIQVGFFIMQNLEDIMNV
jgi:hypothetical protein